MKRRAAASDKEGPWCVMATSTLRGQRTTQQLANYTPMHVGDKNPLPSLIFLPCTRMMNYEPCGWVRGRWLFCSLPYFAVGWYIGTKQFKSQKMMRNQRTFYIRCLLPFATYGLLNTRWGGKNENGLPPMQWPWK